MNNNNILKTDFLDILFKNRNKEYGAYELRKNYNNRLKKSILSMLFLSIVFSLSLSFKKHKITCDLILGDFIELEQHYEKKDIKKEIKKTKLVDKKIELVKQLKVTSIKIEPDNQFIKPIATIDEIDTSNIGTTNTLGTGTTEVMSVNVGVLKSGIDSGHEFVSNVNESKTYSDQEIFEIVEKNPEFPGGAEAMRKFLLRNLMQPDDLVEGEKIIVLAKFIVNKNGEIVEVTIEKSGRADLDEEVIRVIKLMPNWKPAIQNGYPVNVYFRIPISFINSN